MQVSLNENFFDVEESTKIEGIYGSYTQTVLSFARASVQSNFRRDNLRLVFSSLKRLAKPELDFSFNLIIGYPELHWQLMHGVFALF